MSITINPRRLICQYERTERSYSKVLIIIKFDMEVP